MKNKLKAVKSKRAFTLIELITTIAILAILVLVAMPRLMGYTQKAELARIQHDTKVMEQEMTKVILDKEVNFADWDDSPKELGELILKNELFGKEGFAERVDKSHLEKYYNREDLAYNDSSEFGVGGTEILLDDEEKEIGDGYKVIPDEYKSNIKTTLSGTFYTNELGKVYYGHDEPLTTQKDSFIKKCDSPVAADLGYTFNYETMTIEGYDHKEEHLVIPESFKNPETDECVPVRIIGKGAFVIGGYKSVVIPESVHTIEDEAFLNNEFTNVYIPHSVERIGNNAFTGDYISSVTIGRSEGSVNIGDNAFLNRSTGVNIVPNYKTPSAKDLGYIFDVNRRAIVSYLFSNKVVTIPSVVTVNGVEYEVKQIDKGAFQGLGLTAAILPESLERIENYAFSGNQLIGITIPDKVNHIGHYAFAFNEQTHSLTGKKRATIGFINIKEEDYFEKLNKYGDILENGEKVEILKNKVTLLNHIFVTSIDNFVIDEEDTEKEDEDANESRTIGIITNIFNSGGLDAIWVDPNIKDYIPANTEITHTYSTSNDQINWSEETVDFESVGKGRFLKVTSELIVHDGFVESPKLISISPTFTIEGKLGEQENIEKFNEKINFNNYGFIWHVDSENGDDNNSGEKNSPIKSIDVAYNKAGDGDLIYLEKGEYRLKVKYLTKKVDFFGQDGKTTLVFNGPNESKMGLGSAYLGVLKTADSGFYNMIVETRGTNTFSNFFLNEGTLSFYNVAFNNFFNSDFTDFILTKKGSLYLYNTTLDKTASRNYFVRYFEDYDGTLVIQNSYGDIVLDNHYSSLKIDYSALLDNIITKTPILDDKFSILEEEWRGLGIGTNPDGSKANIGVYGGPNAWK